jgi:hypothetical protein
LIDAYSYFITLWISAAYGLRYSYYNATILLNIDLAAQQRGYGKSFMKKRLSTLAISVVVLLMLAVVAPQRVSAASYSINFGGFSAGGCNPGYVEWVGKDGSFSVPDAGGVLLSYTESINGTTYESGTNTSTSWAGAGSISTISGNLSFPSTSYPYTFVGVYSYSLDGEIFSTDTVTVNCTADGAAASGSIVHTAGGGAVSFDGPPIPTGYVLKYISCDVAVYSEPDLGRATSARIKAGQTWFVNPTPVTGADGKQWQQIFTSSSPNGYIPSACIK